MSDGVMVPIRARVDQHAAGGLLLRDVADGTSLVTLACFCGACAPNANFRFPIAGRVSLVVLNELNDEALTLVLSRKLSPQVQHRSESVMEELRDREAALQLETATRKKRRIGLKMVITSLARLYGALLHNSITAVQHGLPVYCVFTVFLQITVVTGGLHFSTGDKIG